MAASQVFTHLTGLKVATNPKPVLLRIYTRTAALLKKMPEHSAYRRHTEDIINYRSSVVKSTDDVSVMEERINCGKIEEVIEQARAELVVAQNFIVTKPWDSLISAIPKNQWKWPMK